MSACCCNSSTSSTTIDSLAAQIACLTEQIKILAARDGQINGAKWEIVDYPASPAADGEAGQIAVSDDGNNLAIYVDGEGWKYALLATEPV